MFDYVFCVVICVLFAGLVVVYCFISLMRLFMWFALSCCWFSVLVVGLGIAWYLELLILVCCCGVVWIVGCLLLCLGVWLLIALCVGLSVADGCWHWLISGYAYCSELLCGV